MKDEFGIEMFEQIVDDLWDNREQLQDKDFVFDYPEYGGIRTEIANKLNSHAVDIIQEIYDPYAMKDVKRKTTLRSLLKDYFFILGHHC